MSYSLPPPDSPATSGLDFADKPYHTSRIDPLARFHENVAQVRRWIEDNLSNFSHLNETIVLRLGSDTLPHQPLTIDATAAPPVLSADIPSTPHRSITILPEYVLDAVEGRMHSQHAFGKRATPPTLGAVPACFAPAGVPGSCAAPADPDALPRPTEDVARLKSDLAQWGYAICANALSAEQVRILRTAVEEQAEAERLVGVGHMDKAHKGEGDQPNQRVWNLPNKGDEFLDLLNHPLIDAVAPWFLGGNFSLFTMSANIARRGTSGIYMHRDQMVMSPDTTAHAYVLNAMWYLTDVSDEKGATRVYPGSHVMNVLPADMNHVGTSIPAAAPAGSCVLLDSRTWHSTGVNTTDEARPVILQSFCRFFVRQIENYQAILSDEVKARLSERQRALLGLPSLGPAGKGQGFASYNWPGTQVGRMRVAVAKD
ncbi:phytanoyl-CoA dioxygenase [Colletotrichum cereale]|nr:phytanoyl-CoA dioxygenase [Colletotrichum cereale]